MIKTLIVNGYNINDIPTFYAEINRVFMKGMDWSLGESLDALDDMLYGGYGAINGKEDIRIVWVNFDQNRLDLGKDLTRNYYRRKLEQPDVFNRALISGKLEKLENGTGKTYFEIILEILSDHPNIELVRK